MKHQRWLIAPAVAVVAWQIGSSIVRNKLLLAVGTVGGIAAAGVAWLLYRRFRPMGSIEDELLRLSAEGRKQFFDAHGVNAEKAGKILGVSKREKDA